MKKRVWLIALGIVIGLPLAAPFWKADRFAPAITTSLERALQRRVEVGEVRLHLLTGPGFTLSDVVIHEDPAVSAEPLAYVTSLVVRLRLWPLLRGGLELSSLRLEEPSVNLMQTAEGVWNVQALLRGSSQATGGVLPDLEVRGGDSISRSRGRSRRTISRMRISIFRPRAGSGRLTCGFVGNRRERTGRRKDSDGLRGGAGGYGRRGASRG